MPDGSLVKKVLMTIIEKENQIGGLAKTIKFKNNFVDIGPHSFFQKIKKYLMRKKFI